MLFEIIYYFERFRHFGNESMTKINIKCFRFSVTSLQVDGKRSEIKEKSLKKLGRESF